RPGKAASFLAGPTLGRPKSPSFPPPTSAAAKTPAFRAQDRVRTGRAATGRAPPCGSTTFTDNSTRMLETLSESRSACSQEALAATFAEKTAPTLRGLDHAKQRRRRRILKILRESDA